MSEPSLPAPEPSVPTGPPSNPTPPPTGPAPNPGPQQQQQQQNATPPPQPPPPQARTQLMDVRDRLFHALFIKAALFYAIMVPRPFRRLIELVLFMKALLAFFSLVYIHYTFSMSPATCLQHVTDYWPRHGVLHIEINRHMPSHQRFDAGLPAPLLEDTIEFQLPQNPMQFDLLATEEKSERMGIFEILDDENYKNYRMYAVLQNLIAMFKSRYPERGESVAPQIPVDESPVENPAAVEGESPVTPPPVESEPPPPQLPEEKKEQREELETSSLLEELAKGSWNGDEEEDQFIFEYSLEYGFLRLSNATRERMNIPVLYVYLNPNTDKCFGDNLSRFILDKFLGYDDLLMASMKLLAEKTDNKGYLRNLVTGEHFRFISSWWVPRGSFVAAFVVMLLFTVSISMLLRYSHHQIFIFIVDLLQMLEFNVSARFPAASLLTVILALVGMEAIMSEFFNDTTTAFYVILIVWVADQFDAICCHTTISKRHWLRFFYLYQYSFYAYHFRFNGQYSGLALVTAWLFIQHSMVYFFHHYELPVIIRQAQLQQIIIRNRNVGGGAGNVQPPGAQQQQQQQRPPGTAAAGGGPAAAGNVNNVGNAFGGLLGVSYRDQRPSNLVVSGFASFRLRPYNRQNHNNNNNVDAQNNNTINAAAAAAAGGDGNNNQQRPAAGAAAPGINGPVNLVPIWNQARAIIGTLRRIAGNGTENNNNALPRTGPTAAVRGENNGPTGGIVSAAADGQGAMAAATGAADSARLGADDQRQRQPPPPSSSQQQHHHHHHHHHHHVHGRLPAIINLGHLQRISLGRMTISPQFTGVVNSANQAQGQMAAGMETSAGGVGDIGQSVDQVAVDAPTTTEGGTTAEVAAATAVENNGCNVSGAEAPTTTTTVAPEMESNAGHGENGDSDASASPLLGNANRGDLIIEPGDKLSEADEAKSIDGIEGIVRRDAVSREGDGVRNEGDAAAATADVDAHAMQVIRNRGSEEKEETGKEEHNEASPLEDDDKFNLTEVSGKFRVPEAGKCSERGGGGGGGQEVPTEVMAVDGRRVMQVDGIDDDGVDQKTEERMFESVSKGGRMDAIEVDNGASQRSGGEREKSTEFPLPGRLMDGVIDCCPKGSDSGGGDRGSMAAAAAGLDKLVNLNVNCNHGVLNSSLNCVLGTEEKGEEKGDEK